jgi:hypothetical protein
MPTSGNGALLFMAIAAAFSIPEASSEDMCAPLPHGVAREMSRISFISPMQMGISDDKSATLPEIQLR